MVIALTFLRVQHGRWKRSFFTKNTLKSSEGPNKVGSAHEVLVITRMSPTRYPLFYLSTGENTQRPSVSSKK